MENNIDSVISLLKNNPEYFKKDITFSKEQSDQISESISLLENGAFSSEKEKGESFEKVIKDIFCIHGLFEVKTNSRTSTNEIDLLLMPTLYGTKIIDFVFNRFLDGNIIVECKNYKKKVDVTWIGKLASLLDVSKVSVGLLITKSGITGRGNWDAGQGLIRKISLKKNILIIDLVLKDFIELDGKNLLDLMKTKIDTLNLDVNFDELWTAHPLEKEFKT
ncbi:restriction endonuclease [Enterococcus dongliensis]|uniref:restriction endonuclease n=1 Tax=Enterococcus dongliensis TaxID=2559925 RepID=UPI00288ECE74|nr:restriction endonuclease [Enterococcus dongliensis]MDT2669509.1 restriction endonuclease [Enterococcus dongliensis]